LPDEAVDLGRDQELQNLSVPKEKEKAVERVFEMGVCHLMGFGFSKDVTRGMRIIVTAAKHGCRRGRALSSALATSYGLDTCIPGKTLEEWLFKTGTRGSKPALRELQLRFPNKYREALVVNRFTGDPRYPELLNYHDHILPHFNLSDTQILSTQIESALSRIKMDQQEDPVLNPPSSHKDIFAMLRETNPNDAKMPYYFVLGSLLHLASLFGFADAVLFLLDAGYDIDAHSSQPFLRTPLLCALSRGHSAVAKILIERGANCEPLIMWAEEDKCFTPSPLHYLVNIDDEKEVKELAKLLVKKGADVNCKCSVEQFQWQTPSGIPSSRGRSVTPLRWAVIHGKAHLVKVLLSLGAKFSYVEYLNPSKLEGGEKFADQKGCLLLETPCTDPDILEMFFARARVPGLPSDFQATPLGLLISEDDGPERRLRPGFEDSDKVIDAIRLLLELQPGYEDVLVWSAVRHDHADIVKFLLGDLGWSIETRWKGLTLLHTALLYGRVELVRYLLEEGADVRAVTKMRHLTYMHLIMLHPRSPDTDRELLDILSTYRIDLDAKETVDGLTALHIAVRNGKLQALKYLIQLGADPGIPATDQLQRLSSGRNGYLIDVHDKPMIFSKSLNILGEVIIQCLQDGYYSFAYVADLIVLFLEPQNRALSEEDLIIDKENGMTLLHLLAVARDPALGGKVYERDSHRRDLEEKSKIMSHTADISLLQLVLLRFPKDLVNIKDSQRDTPLHYACAAHQTHNIRTLLAWGADSNIRNKFGFNAVEILAWSCIYLGNKTFKFGKASKPWDHGINKIPHALSSEPLQTPLSASDLYQAFEIFEELGHTVDPRLRQLALAWDNAKMDEGKTYFSVYSTESGNHLQLVPEDVGKGKEVEEESESDELRGKAKGKRKYLVTALAGPQRERERAYKARARDEERLAL
jgi:ankyrin repeat protein